MTVAELSERLRNIPGNAKIHVAPGKLRSFEFLTLACKQGSDDSIVLAHLRPMNDVAPVVFK